MTQNWIKIRCNLLEHPKVWAMVRFLWESQPGGSLITENANSICSPDFTRRAIVLAGLLKIWAHANEFVTESNGEFVTVGVTLRYADDVAGVNKFGEAMVNVGWLEARIEGETQILVFPNFTEFNRPDTERQQALSGAERARRFREKNKEARNGTVTERVTDAVTVRNGTVTKSNGREEERRLDKIYRLPDSSNPPVSPKSTLTGDSGSEELPTPVQERVAEGTANERTGTAKSDSPQKMIPEPSFVLQRDTSEARSLGVDMEKLDSAKIVADSWNLMAQKHGLPQVAKLTHKRAAAINSRLADSWWRKNWQNALDLVAKNPYLLGDNDRGWKANIDWFVRPDTVVKLIEGGAGDVRRRQNTINKPGQFDDFDRAADAAGL